MKTTRELLHEALPELTKELNAAFTLNADVDLPATTARPARALIMAFVWDDTVEGHRYWQDIHEHLGGAY